jgi:hypothetical protein
MKGLKLHKHAFSLIHTLMPLQSKTDAPQRQPLLHAYFKNPPSIGYYANTV